MNERDSEQVARMFVEGGYTVTTEERDADAVLVNTCSVRDQAEQKALGKMGGEKALFHSAAVLREQSCPIKGKSSGFLNEDIKDLTGHTFGISIKNDDLVLAGAPHQSVFVGS